MGHASKETKSIQIESCLNQFQVGDRVVTPTGKIGVIIEPEHDLPLHCLVQLSDETKRHILKRILKLED